MLYILKDLKENVEAFKASSSQTPVVAPTTLDDRLSQIAARTMVVEVDSLAGFWGYLFKGCLIH